MAIVTRWLLFVTLASGCLATEPLPRDVDEEIAEYVNRIKRHAAEEIHGHSLGMIHAEDPDTGHVHRLRKRDVLAHVAHPSPTRRFTLQLQGSDHSPLDMTLTRRSAATSATRILERLADGTHVRHEVPQDCFFAGPLAGGDRANLAVLSLCGGRIMGTVETEKRYYEILPLPVGVAERYRRSTDLEHVLVTWSDRKISRDEDDLELHRIEKREADDEQVDADKYFGDDGLKIPDERKRRDTSSNETVRRGAASRSPVVETAAYMDKSFVRKQINAYGDIANDAQWLTQAALLKFSGIRSVYADPKLSWNITYNLVYLEIFMKADPVWLNPTGNLSFEALMGRICTGTRDENYDQVILWTNAPSKKGRAGLAWITGVCRRKNRCCVSRNSGLGFSTDLHELGHGLGLKHEGRMPTCINGTDQKGFMSSWNTYMRHCYDAWFNRTLPPKSCLYTESFAVPEDGPVKLLLPGQQLSRDEQCKFFEGSEFRYRHSDTNVCKEMYCMVVEADKVNYGTVVKSKATTGTPCAPGRMCERSQCLPLNETSFAAAVDPEENGNVIVDGGWGPWEPLPFDCSEETPSGAVSVRASSRQCNSPPPENGLYCQGPSHMGELCLPPTAYSLWDKPFDMREMIDGVCSGRLGQYTGGSGQLAGTTGDINTCSVRCERSNKKKAYTVPDGVPCEGPASSSDDELRGVRRYCVGGVCLPFGCDGRSLGEGGGVENDVCGVCGGFGDTCVHDTFTGPLARDERHTLVTLPVGATDIYVYHPLNKQTDVSIEIWTKDVENNQPVVSRKRGVGYRSIDRNTPLSFADTYWFYNKALQSLSASGPLDQPVRIAIYKSESNDFQQVFYRFTPRSDPAQSVDCENGGTQFAGGCSCPEGFYGLSCEHTCSLLCRNGATVDTKRCRCRCNDRQTGTLCDCQAPYGGPNCRFCTISGCKNGGTFLRDECRCDCPVNCDGYDCSEQCRNTRNDTACERRKRKCRKANFAKICSKTCELCAFNTAVNNGQCGSG